MTFLLYQTVSDKGVTRLRPADGIDKSFRLPYLLQCAWKTKGSPVNRGWEVSADELICIHCSCRETYQTRRLLSDFHPSSRERIGVIEFMHIYAFTWGSVETPSWTPFMVKGRDVFYREDYENLGEAERKKVLDDLPEYKIDGSTFVEFLYSNVNKNGNWVWGRSGMANAAFLHKEAWAFFKTVF